MLGARPIRIIPQHRPIVSARRAALAFIVVSIVLDIVTFGIVIPVLPQLIRSFPGGAAAGAARKYGVFGTIWALVQFIA